MHSIPLPPKVGGSGAGEQDVSVVSGQEERITQSIERYEDYD